MVNSIQRYLSPIDYLGLSLIATVPLVFYLQPALKWGQRHPLSCLQQEEWYAETMKKPDGAMDTMKTVLIALHPFDEAGVRLLEVAGWNVLRNPHGRHLTAAELSEWLPVCQAVIAGTESYSETVLQAAPQLRLIARVGVGVDNIDVLQAYQQGIKIVTTQAAAVSVAEFTLGLMLALVRGIVPSHQAMVGGQWRRVWGKELAGQTLGLIGCGAIGQRVARLAQAIGMQVNGHDLYQFPEVLATVGIQTVSLAELLETSLVVSLHLPLTPTSHHLINAHSLQQMPVDAYLINTSRGGLVDETALFQALQSGHLAGAALDVFEQEPYTGELATLDNVILTAHMAGNSHQARLRMEQDAVQAVVDFGAEW